MRDIYTIIFRLTLSCILAALVMGGTYIVTNNAKIHNEHVKEQKVRYALLGYDSIKPAPQSVALHVMYRYVVSGHDRQFIGYLLPMKEKSEATHCFVLIDLNGKFVEKRSIAISLDQAKEQSLRDAAVQDVLGPEKTIRFADQTIIATDGGRRTAYLLGGKFQGFKTFVSVMLAIDPTYTIKGLEILEHEEDPGLGAEIKEDYFRKQFNDKPIDVLKTLAVTKTPLPEEYQNALEGEVEQSEALTVIEQYRDHDIYALTGATISSRAVTDGVKGIVRKFVYRFTILETVIQEQQLTVAF